MTPVEILEMLYDDVIYEDKNDRYIIIYKDKDIYAYDRHRNKIASEHSYHTYSQFDKVWLLWYKEDMRNCGVQIILDGQDIITIESKSLGVSLIADRYLVIIYRLDNGMYRIIQIDSRKSTVMMSKDVSGAWGKYRRAAYFDGVNQYTIDDNGTSVSMLDRLGKMVVEAFKKADTSEYVYIKTVDDRCMAVDMERMVSIDSRSYEAALRDATAYRTIRWIKEKE